MKKFLTLLVLVCAAVTAGAADGFAAGIWFNSPKEVNGTSVEGIALGIPVIKFKDLSGASLAICANVSEKTSGFQGALFGFNNAASLEGAQIAFVNLLDKQHGDCGLQIGAYNQSGENGVQLGLINNARNNASFQLGLININKNGLLPVMIFINFGKTILD